MYITHGGHTVELLYLSLGVCSTALIYLLYKLAIIKKAPRSSVYSKQKIRDMKTAHCKKNIFRQMAIEEIARQKLVYDERSGGYVRRRLID